MCWTCTSPWDRSRTPRASCHAMVSRELRLTFAGPGAAGTAPTGRRARRPAAPWSLFRALSQGEGMLQIPPENSLCTLVGHAAFRLLLVLLTVMRYSPSCRNAGHCRIHALRCGKLRNSCQQLTFAAKDLCESACRILDLLSSSLCCRSACAHDTTRCCRSAPSRLRTALIVGEVSREKALSPHIEPSKQLSMTI